LLTVRRPSRHGLCALHSICGMRDDMHRPLRSVS
jgi:hypothetical protein